jgi:hypothetical protein
VLITAKIDDRNWRGLAPLLYQTVNPGAYIKKTDAAYATGWTSLAMNDAGTDGDTTAGDGIYSATIPPRADAPPLVRYRIQAADTLGGSVTVPYADDEQPNFAYFCYNGVPRVERRRAARRGGSPRHGADLSARAARTHPALSSHRRWQPDVSNSQYNTNGSL